VGSGTPALRAHLAGGGGHEPGRTGRPEQGARVQRLVPAAAGYRRVRALFIGPGRPIAFGLVAGGAAGLGWVATAFGVVYLFEAGPLAQRLVNAGYFVATPSF
jgi:hypothetical protein